MCRGLDAATPRGAIVHGKVTASRTRSKFKMSGILRILLTYTNCNRARTYIEQWFAKVRELTFEYRISRLIDILGWQLSDFGFCH